ncbi:MAG: thioredoxin family protein [Bacteroidetes bacterium]|nr:thioredoxin family protein [Bacteroidota bacterium]
METKSALDIKNYYSYDEYKHIVFKLAEEGKNSGEPTAERIAATNINAQRIKRIDKQCELHADLVALTKNLKSKYEWILITESWCGDGAQSIPVISKIAECNPNIELKLIFRDENLSVMDSFLTNGTRSIPKLIFINKTSNEIIGTWGPRPEAIQNMVTYFKAEFPQADHDELVKNLHLWYARDKTNAIQEEFKSIIRHWE